MAILPIPKTHTLTHILADSFFDLLIEVTQLLDRIVARNRVSLHESINDRWMDHGARGHPLDIGDLESRSNLLHREHIYLLGQKYLCVRLTSYRASYSLASTVPNWRHRRPGRRKYGNKNQVDRRGDCG